MPEPLQHLRPRLARIVERIVEIAEGQGAVALPVEDVTDELDAVLLGLNMLAEVLADERARREHAEALLYDERMSYDEAPALFCSLAVDTLEVVKCNRGLVTTLGVSETQVVGRSFVALVAAHDAERAEQVLRAAAAGEPVDAVIALARAGRADVLVSFDGAVSESRGERPARLRLVGRDVTVEQSLEEQLVRAQRMEAIGRVAGGVAHDFNNIMTVIQTCLGVLAASASLDREARDEVRTAAGAAHKATALTGDLLAFARQQPVTPERIDVARHVRDNARFLRRALGGNVAVELDDAGGAGAVEIDPGRLQQVLLNLAVNARDAMPDGGVLTIATYGVNASGGREGVDIGAGPDTSARPHEAPTGRYTVIAVTDTGTGIPPDVMRQMFEPFFTTKPLGRGTGLGLSTCYGIVRQAGGHLLVESEVDVGTTFRICLPVVSEVAADAVSVGARGATSDAAGERLETSDVESAAHPGAGTVALVVDDDDVVRMVVSRTLRRGGYDVIEASGGAEALEIALRTEDITVLVTDMRMPGMSGRELADELRVLLPALKVLLISGYTGDAFELERTSGLAFLQKPFTGPRLLAALHDLLA